MSACEPTALGHACLVPLFVRKILYSLLCQSVFSFPPFSLFQELIGQCLLETRPLQEESNSIGHSRVCWFSEVRTPLQQTSLHSEIPNCMYRGWCQITPLLSGNRVVHFAAMINLQPSLATVGSRPSHLITLSRKPGTCFLQRRFSISTENSDLMKQISWTPLLT